MSDKYVLDVLPVVGVENGGVSGEIGRTTRIRLDIDAPFGRIQSVSLQSAAPAQVLDLVNKFVATIVPVTGHALGVLVRQGAAEGLDNREGREVLRRYEFDSPALPALFLLN